MLDDVSFPSADKMRDGFWQPVYFSPNFDSSERLIVAVVANVDGRWEIARASALERLRCLYGAEASTALQAIEVGLEYLSTSVQARDYEAKLPEIVSGLTVGPRSAAQATSAEELAKRWLRLTSSLHSSKREHVVAEAVATSPVDTIRRDISRDRLPVLVLAELSRSAPQMREMFNPHILRMEQEHGARLLTHKAFVAFTGQHLAANFATLKAGQQKVVVTVSKRLMWDLEQHRGSEGKLLPRHAHEMLLYHPGKDDPTITTRQYDNLIEVIDTLRREGDNRQIGVKSYESVPEIAEHILTIESAKS